MSEIKKKGNIRVKTNQIEMIVNAMEENNFLNENKFSSLYTALQRTEDWEMLAQKLNSAGGAIKNVKAWQKCWSDKKSEVKKKNRVLKAARQKTGGGQVIDKDLTQLEERILLLIGLDAAEGLEIEESDIAIASACIPAPEEGQILEVEDRETEDVLSTSILSTSEQPQPSTSKNTTTSEQPQPSTSKNTTKNPNHTKDWRRRSMHGGTRTKPVVLRAENSKQLLESEKEIASALTQCAEALQQQNFLKQEELKIMRENLATRKEELEIKIQKANALIVLANTFAKKFAE